MLAAEAIGVPLPELGPRQVVGPEPVQAEASAASVVAQLGDLELLELVEIARPAAVRGLVETFPPVWSLTL